MPASAPVLVARVPPRVAVAPRFSPLAAIQALSLDVVAGVVCAAAFAASAAGATMPLAWWVALPAATFVVYALDHLLDVRRGKPVQSDRRRLHRRLAPALVVHTAVAAAAALAAAAFLPRAMLPGGVVLAVAAAVHLVLAQTAGDRFLKELTAGVIYVLAIWYGPLTQGGRVDVWVALLATAHGAAALANLGVFTLFEQAADSADGQASTARGWGAARLRRWIHCVTVAGAIVGLAVVVLGPARLTVHAAVVVVLVVTPLLLDGARRLLARGEAFRTWGDLAFLAMLLPAVLA